MNNNKSLKSFIRIMIMFVLIFVIISSCFNGGKKKNTFKIIASTSTRSMESSIKKFAKDNCQFVNSTPKVKFSSSPDLENNRVIKFNGNRWMNNFLRGKNKNNYL